MVADIMMPPLGLLLGKVDFSNWFVVIKQGTTAGPYATMAQAQAAGATTLNLGLVDVGIHAMEHTPIFTSCLLDRGIWG